MASVESFLLLLHSHAPNSEEPDKLIWKLKRSGIFDISSYYLMLRDPTAFAFPWKSIWRVKAPRRVSFFVWTAAWGRILTCDNLMKRGYVMAGWCCMCKRSGESVDHLLLHCDVVREVWNFFLQSFGVSWVFPETVSDLLFGWHNRWGKQSSRIWNLVPHCIMWIIWWERNSRTFEDKDHSSGKIIERAMGSLYDWSSAWGLCLSQSLGEFLESLSFSFSTHHV